MAFVNEIVKVKRIVSFNHRTLGLSHVCLSSPSFCFDEFKWPVSLRDVTEISQWDLVWIFSKYSYDLFIHFGNLNSRYIKEYFSLIQIWIAPFLKLNINICIISH